MELPNQEEAERTKPFVFYKGSIYKFNFKDDYRADPMFNALLNDFLPSLKKNSSKGIEFVFTPIHKDRRYENEPFPPDYEETDRYRAFVRNGFKATNVRPVGTSSYLIDFEPPKETDLESKLGQSESQLENNSSNSLKGILLRPYGIISSIPSYTELLQKVRDAYSSAKDALTLSSEQREIRRKIRKNHKNHSYDSRSI